MAPSQKLPDPVVKLKRQIAALQLQIVHLKHRFPSDHYQRHNRRRQEHLASLGIDLRGKRVLEVGAGIGDHTSFFLDRGCSVFATDARRENIAVLRRRFPAVRAAVFDIEQDDDREIGRHDVVYAYGVLYHLRDPERAMARFSSYCEEMLLLETCVSFGSECAINLVSENADNPTQSISGIGCRPTRPWVFQALRNHFPYVYLPTTQPWHEEFPTDWTRSQEGQHGLARAIFVSSRRRLDNPLLTETLLDHQVRL